MRKSWIVLLLASASPLSFGSDIGFVQGYYVNETDKTQFGNNAETRDEGDGFGFGGQFILPSGVLLSGEYQTLQFDEEGGDYEQEETRFGVGLIAPLSPTLELFGLAQINNFEITENGNTEEISGPGFHIGLRADISDSAEIYGRYGILELENEAESEIDGDEILLGIATGTRQRMGFVAEYRLTSLDLEPDIESELSQFRIGLRYAF